MTACGAKTQVHETVSEDGVTLSDDSSGFALLSEAVPDAILEIRYYSTYNLVGERIDGYEEPLALLTKEAASALKEVSDELLTMGFRLKIFDAYRPQMAVTHFMNWALDADDTRMKEYFYPELDKDVLFPQGYIAERSGHSRGSTVDLTLFDMATEKEADMGGTFDYFGELSHPDYTGITREQYENRMILREVMLKHGFKPLEEEWWHFTLENEPYPDTYFTFPINSDSITSADTSPQSEPKESSNDGGTVPQDTVSQDKAPAEPQSANRPDAGLSDLWTNAALSLWTDAAPAKAALTAYMDAVTDETGAEFIPVENRIAVFDLDGTLFCETDPNYFDYTLLKYRVLEDPDYKDKASDFEKEVANKIKEQNETGKSFSGLEVDHGRAVASAFSGMTVEEFNDYIQEFKKLPMPGYDGMLRGEGWYQPMLEIVDYLKENDFKVYVVSGTDRLIVRGIAYELCRNVPTTLIMGTYFYRNMERRNPETERDCGQKGSYNKAGVIALGGNAPHRQA